MDGHNEEKGSLWRDLCFLVLSIALAVYLVRSGILTEFLRATEGFSAVGIFIAGLFFTSIFTTAPAVIALGQLGQHYGVFPVALIGAIGAMVGDYILFKYIRDRFAEHLFGLVGHRHVGRKLHALFHLRLFRWVSIFIGGLIIVSPLPDEAALALFGVSKLKTSWFIILSYGFNFIGITLIALVAQHVAASF